MSELVKREFPTRALMNGLRAIGYSFSTAVADIIDNSISAEANMVNVYFDPLASTPYFCILDNGIWADLASGSNQHHFLSAESL